MSVEFAPTLFFKIKAEGILLSSPYVRLSVHLSVMISHPKPLDEIQPNLVRELFTGMGRATAKKNAQAPGEVSKILNFNNKVNFKDFFIPNFVCVLVNKRHKPYRAEFCSDAWVMHQGWDLKEGVHRGSIFLTWSCGISN